MSDPETAGKIAGRQLLPAIVVGDATAAVVDAGTAEIEHVLLALAEAHGVGDGAVDLGDVQEANGGAARGAQAVLA